MADLKKTAAQQETTAPKVTDDDLRAQADALGVSVLIVVPKNIDRGSVRLISEEVARKYRLCAFEKDGATLRVATVDPQNIDALNVLRFIAQKDRLSIEIFLTSESVLDELYGLYGSAEKAIEEAMHAIDNDDAELRSQKKKKKGNISAIGIEQENIQDTPVAKLVQVIIRHALSGSASDIHIEPVNNNYRVRFRLDGILHSSLTFPDEVGRAVVSRIKILASLKIDEKRKPQDGRFRIDDEGNAVDFRVSTLPVVEGEKIVMRVLEKDRQTFDLKKLGLMGTNHDIFMRRIRDPYGMLLMTGPTGSGKSTTLYAFLRILNKEVRNIITLEDPVEYFIPGINQSQVKPEIGYTFASGLRSILRQDPNVIMVGEIRDNETAELAIHAALTGHLVFSTVHTNSAAGAVPRLVDMGVEPFLLASSFKVVAAQRLVRKICEECKEERTVPDAMRTRLAEVIASVTPEEMRKYDLDPEAPRVFYKGKGCDECGNLGYKGRVAIYEVLEINADIQDIITEKGGNLGMLERYIKNNNIVTMKQDGVLKALLGATTIAELERVTEGSLSIGGKIDEVGEGEMQSTRTMPPADVVNSSVQEVADEIAQEQKQQENYGTI